MNLLVDASNLGSGGALTQIHQFLDYCENDARIQKLIILTHQSNDIQIKKYANSRKSIFIRNNDIKIYFMGITRKHIIKKLVRIHNIDLLFIPGFGQCRDLNIPVVAMFRNMLPLDLRSILRYGIRRITLRLFLLRYLYKFFFKNADGVIFLNTVVHKISILKGFHTESQNDVIIPHGVSDEIITKQKYQKNFDDEKLKIIYVSSDEPYKNHLKLIQELKFLNPKYKERCEFIFLGNFFFRNQKKLLKLAERYNIELKIKKPLQRDDLHAAYYKYDLAIFASSCENMPNILLEKMKAGLPILSHSNSINNYFIRDNFMQFTFQSEELSRKIEHLIDNPSILASSGQENLSSVRCYNWSDSSERIVTYLNDFSDTKCK